MKILLVILGFICLILCVPVGVDIGYCEGEVSGYIRVSSFVKKVYPISKKEQKKKEKETKTKKNIAFSDVTKEEVLDGVSVLVTAVKKLQFHLHKLKIHFVSAFADPYRTAMVYGYANAAVQAFALPSLKQSDIQLAVDFERETCYVDGYVSVTIRIYYIMKLVCCLIVGGIPLLIRRHKRLKGKENSVAVKGKVA